MLQICNPSYVSEIAPTDWQRGVISPLFKKGEESMCDTYRGITFLSHYTSLYTLYIILVIRVYTRILEKRLRACLESLLNDSQYGFHSGRGTADAIFVVNMLLEKGWEWDIDKYALFIEIEKAFDRVDRVNI